MISEKDIELMDNYLAGNLSKEEVVIFNNRLKHDQDFKKEFNLISSIADAFKRDELKEELDQLEHKLNKEEGLLLFKYLLQVAKDFKQYTFIMTVANRYITTKTKKKGKKRRTRKYN